MSATIKVFLITSLALGVFGANIRIPSNKAFQCPPEDGFYPGDEPCTSDYYYCGSGNAFPAQCPCSDPDRCTVFDPAQGACVDPDIASCSPGGGTGGTSGTTVGPTNGGLTEITGGLTDVTSGLTDFTTGGGPTTAGAATATPAPSLPPFDCPADGFYPVPGTCGPNFYICAGSIVAVGVCPEGTLFDPVSYVCALESETSCNVPFTCPENDGFFPYPGACSSIYYICISGQGFLQYCPASTIFDPLVHACVQEPSCTPGEYSSTERTTTTQGPTTTTPFSCPANGNYPMAGECKKYYICTGGTAFEAVQFNAG